MLKLRGQRMLEILAIKKMRQSDLAAAIGISKGHLNNVLKGRRGLSLKHSKLLIGLFGADLMSQLIDWKAMRLINPFEEAK